MIKTTIVLIVLIMLLRGLNAQPTTDNYILSEAHSTSCFGKKIVQGESIISFNEKDIITYDKNTLEIISSKEIKNIPQNEECFEYIYFGGSCYYFYYPNVKKIDKSISFTLRKLNIETSTFEAPQVIFEAPLVRKDYRENGFSFAEFMPIPHFKISKDSSKLAIISRKKVLVFEKNMKLLWKTDNMYGEYHLDGPIDIQSTFLDDNGDFYSIIKVFNYDGVRNKKRYDWGDYKESIDKSETPNYNVKILKANGDGVEHLYKNILTGQLIHSLTLHKDNHGNLYCAGAYFADRNIGRTAGFFLINLEDQLLKVNKFKIPKEIEHYRKKNIPDVQKGMEYLRNLKIINCLDGNFLILSEQSLDFDPAGIYDPLVGCFGNILAFKVSTDGEIIWSRILTKWQLCSRASYWGYNSYRHLFLNNKHYIIYLDNRGNEELNLKKNGRYCSNAKNSVVMSYILDEAGHVEKKILFDLDKLTNRTDYNFKESIKPISNNEIILSTYQKKGNFSLGKISIK